MSQSDGVPKSLKSIPDAAKELGISVAGMRWIRFNASRKAPDGNVKRMLNGFDRAFVNIGRRVFVDMEAFYRCTAEQNGRLPMEGGSSSSGRTARKEAK